MKIPNKLETKRLILRPFFIEDFENFCKFLEDKHFRKSIKYQHKDLTTNEVLGLFNDIIKSYNTTSPNFALIIADKLSNVCLGSCGLTVKEACDEFECYYILFPQYWGNGYAIEAMRKLFEYAFLELHLSKLVAYIPSGNTHGWKVAERAGMKYLGDLTNEVLPQRDMFFTIEKKEFENQSVF